MAKQDRSADISSSNTLQNWKQFWMRTVGDMGIFGACLRVVVLVLFALYFVLPLIWFLLAPSKGETDIINLNPLAFGSFERLSESWQKIIGFQHGEVLLWLKNSIWYAFASLILGLVICIPAGYILAVARFRGRTLLLWLTLITMLIPTPSLVLPLFMELNAVHLVNTQWAVILPAVFFPFGAYLTYIFISTNLPPDLLDAARVDGCSEVQLFLQIALPLAKPLLGLLAFINFTGNWNNFFLPYVMLNDDKIFNLPVGIQQFVTSTSAIRPGFNPNPGITIHYQQAEAAMLGLIMVVPVVIVFLISQRYVVSGAFTGSVKG